MSRSLALGVRAEDAAAEFLLSKGFQIITRNWRCRAGELDIIARQGSILVVVEVKSGQEHRRKNVLDRVDYRKRGKLKILTEIYQRYNRQKFSAVRIDVIAVVEKRDSSLYVYKHIKAI